MKFVIWKTTVGDREEHQRKLEVYRSYLELLHRQNLLITAGTFDDRSGGMLLVETEGLEQAIELARRDPMVQAGIDRYQVRGWIPALGDDNELNGFFGPTAMPADTGPIQIPLFEENFQVIEAAEHPQHARLLTQCLGSKNIDPEDQLRKTYLRKAESRGFEKLVLVYDEKVIGQIEFAPPEACGFPIDGKSLTVINCLWVLDAYRGLEAGRRLLAACAERTGSESLATVAFNDDLPWLARSFYMNQGFVVVDQVETGRFFGNTPIVAYLLWRVLSPGALPPIWDRKKLLEGVSFCPGYPWLQGRRLYWGQEFDYHGMLVKEGLRRPEVLNQLPCLATHRADRWTFVKLGVPQSDLNRAVELIQAALLDEPVYFAHLYGDSKLVVIFPDRVFRISRDPFSWEEAIRYGIDLGIPEEELVFHPSSFEEETF